MDALAVLREYASTGRSDAVSVSADVVRVGADFRFDAAAPTRWAAAKGTGALLTAGAAAFFVACGAAAAPAGAFRDYVRAAREVGVPTVAIVDRKVREKRGIGGGGAARAGAGAAGGPDSGREASTTHHNASATPVRGAASPMATHLFSAPLDRTSLPICLAPTTAPTTSSPPARTRTRI